VKLRLLTSIPVHHTWGGLRLLLLDPKLLLPLSHFFAPLFVFLDPLFLCLHFTGFVVWRVLENRVELKPWAVDFNVLQSFLSCLYFRQNEVVEVFFFVPFMQVLKLYFAGRSLDFNQFLLLGYSLVVQSFKIVQFFDSPSLLFKFLALSLELLFHLLLTLAPLIFNHHSFMSLLTLKFPKLPLLLFFIF